MLNLYEVALPETHQRIWEDVSAPFTISLPDLAAPVSCLGKRVCVVQSRSGDMGQGAL